MKKRTLTLLEIMIVISLIILITGAIGYNMRGSLDRGRVFRTEQGMEQLRDMLQLCLADGCAMADLLNDQKRIAALENLRLAKDPKKLLEDGWGQKFVITQKTNEDDFEITSDKYKAYKAKH